MIISNDLTRTDISDVNSVSITAWLFDSKWLPLFIESKTFETTQCDKYFGWWNNTHSLIKRPFANISSRKLNYLINTFLHHATASSILAVTHCALEASCKAGVNGE